MQVFAADVLNSIFYWLPASSLPKVGRVCRRFAGLVDHETYWQYRLKERFGITSIQLWETNKAVYRKCFDLFMRSQGPLLYQDKGHEALRFIADRNQPVKMRVQILDRYFIEIENGYLKILWKDNCVFFKKVERANYSLAPINDHNWLAKSPIASYIINTAVWSCTKIASEAVTVNITHGYIAFVGQSVYIYDRYSFEKILERNITLNGVAHLNYISFNEIAFVTSENELILLGKIVEIISIQEPFKPIVRINDACLYVEKLNKRGLFDLITHQFTEHNLGAYIFKSDDVLGFFKNESVEIRNGLDPVLLQCYPVGGDHVIQLIADVFFLCRVGDFQHFRILFFDRNCCYWIENPKRSMQFLGYETPFLFFGSFNALTLRCIAYNVFTKETHDLFPIHHAWFKNVSRLVSKRDLDQGHDNVMVVTYERSSIVVKIHYRENGYFQADTIKTLAYNV